MATIDNLNFKVILDDKEFTKKIQTDLNAAKKLNEQLSQLLTVQAKMNALTEASLKATQKANKLKAEETKLAFQLKHEVEKLRQEQEKTAAAEARTATEKEKTRRATAEALAAEERLRREREKGTTALHQNTTELVRQSGIVSQLQSLIGSTFSVYQLFNFGKQLAVVTGEFEKQRVALRNIVQDANGADALFDRIKRLAIDSPYTFQDLTSYVKQMAAFSVPMDELYDKTKMLADISAGLGVDMNRLILAYGQVKAATVLRGQEVRQFTEAGVPLLRDLAKELEKVTGEAVTTADVFDRISKKQVSFEMVDRVLSKLVSEGGMFYNMQGVLAETLGGKIQKLKDAYQQMLFAIGESNSGVLHGVFDAIIGITRNYDGMLRVIKQLVIVFSTYQAAALATSAATSALGRAAIFAYSKLKAFYAANPYAAAIAGVVALIAAFHDLSKVESDVQKIQSSLNRTIESYGTMISDESSKLDYLWEKLENAKKGTDEYDKAHKAIIARMGSYLSEVDKEAIAIGNLEGVYERLKIAITRAAQERYYQQGLDDIESYTKDARKRILTELNKAFDSVGISNAGIRMELIDFFNGITDTLSAEAQKAYDKLQFQGNIKSMLSRNILGQALTSLGDAKDIKNFDALKEEMGEVNKAAADAEQRLLDSMEKMRSGVADEGDKTVEELKDWQTAVNNTITEVLGDNAKESEYFISSSTRNIDKYIDSLQGKYKKLDASVKNGSQKYSSATLEEMKTEKDLIEKLLTEVLEAPLVKPKANDNEESKEQKAIREQIAAYKDEISILQKLQSTYDKLRDRGFSDADISELMKGFFPDIDAQLHDSLKYNDRIKEIAVSLRSLGKDGVAEADSAITSLGKDAVTSFIDAFDAGQKFFDAMQTWLSKDYGIEGADAIFDISKIIANLKNSNLNVDTKAIGLKKAFDEAKNDEKALNLLRQKLGEEFWNKYVIDGELAINKLTADEKEANRKKAQESISNLATKYTKEDLGFDETSFANMTKHELQLYKDRVQAMINQITDHGIIMTPELEKKMKEEGLTMEKLKEGVLAGLLSLVKKIDHEEEEIDNKNLKEMGKSLSKAAQWGKSLASELSKLADATDSTFLKDLSDYLNGISSIAQNIGQGFDKGGMKGAILGGVIGFVEQLAIGFTQDAEEAKEAAKCADDYAHSLQMLQLELNGDYSTIWGEKSFGKLAEYFADSTLALNLYKKELDSLNEYYDKNSDKTRWLKRVDIFDDEALKGLQKMQVLTKDRNGFMNWLGFYDQYTQLGKLAPQIFDKNGELNLEEAEKFLETNTQLDDTQKRQIQNVIDLKRAYKDLEESIESALSELVGQLSSDLVNEMLDNFFEAGDAVADLEDSFRSLGQTIIESLMNSYLINDILDEFSPRIKELFNDYSEGKTTAVTLASQLGDITDGIKEKLVSSGDYINSLIEAFRERGLIEEKEGGSSSKTLSGGIKAVTENTASLLASYINAIRADVAYGRVQRDGIANDLKTLLGLIPSTPTLTEYLTQIQANTYNSAVAAQDILAELRSVIAPYDGGGYAINVNN